MKREIKILLIVLLIAFLVRVTNLNKTIIFDEYVQTKAVLEHNALGLDKGTGITPLTTWTRIVFTWLMGVHTWSLKLVSVVFGLLSLVLVYFLAKELYDKKTALWASLLIAVSAWHVLGTTSISFDGAFLTFYYLLTIFCFVKYLKTESRKWLYFTGIAFGLAMLTKLNAILIIPIIIIYSLIKEANIKKAVKDFLIIGLVSILVFSVFPIAAYFTDWSYFSVVMQHTGVFENPSFNIVLLLIQYMLAVFWAGPLFIGLYIIKLLRFDRKDVLMHLWIGVVFLFFTFVVQENFRPLERYFMVIFPPICILGGDYISKLRFDKRDLIKFFCVFVVFGLLLFLLNLLNNDILPFYPKTEFIKRAIGFKWNFLVPFTGDQGPIGMYVAFISIVLSFVFAFLFLILHFFAIIYKKRYATKMFFLIFLAISFSYNIFMLQEMIFNSTNPNIDLVSKAAIDYALENDLKEPVYVFRNDAFKYYLSPRYQDVIPISFRHEFDIETINKIKNGGTVIVVDFPSVNKESTLWKGLNSCNMRKSFYDKNIRIGYIFECV